MNYGSVEVLDICTMFARIDCRRILDEWSFLLLLITEEPDFCKLKNSGVVPFWSEMLAKRNLPWTDSTIWLIHVVLTLPIGSAEAERGFSIMNHILNPRRMRLASKNVEHLLRVRINGPETITELSASKYARKWIQDKHKRCDDSNGNPDSMDENVDKNLYFPGSTLF